jgi:hypothetical protein
MADHASDEHRTQFGGSATQVAEDMPKSMGHLFPVGDIMAVIDDRGDAELCVHALNEAGVPEGQIELVEGAWFAKVMRANEDAQNPFQRVVALLAAEEGEAVRDYIEEADDAHTILVVHAKQPEMWDGITSVLRTYNAHHLKHFGPLVTTDL